LEETGWSEFREPRLLGRAQFDCSPFGKDEIHYRWFFHLEIQGAPPETWRHRELDPEGYATVQSIEFMFFWRHILNLESELIADHGRMLPALQELLGLKTTRRAGDA
jgi:hypothetical protein